MPLQPSFDINALPFGKAAGENKHNTINCTTCGAEPHRPPIGFHNHAPQGVWPFRNEISAREYYISGMCQSCQDSVFGAD